MSSRGFRSWDHDVVTPSTGRKCEEIMGPAYTVRFVLRSETSAPVLETLETHYIDAIPSGAVIFITVPKGVENATYGGLMSHRARYSGALGTVVDGRFRDLDEQRKLAFPVFARDVATPAYHEVARPSEVNVPITLQDGETTIQPGDLIVANLNGVVCIPEALERKVEELLPLIKEADEKVEADLRKG